MIPSPSHPPAHDGPRKKIRATNKPAKKSVWWKLPKFFYPGRFEDILRDSKTAAGENELFDGFRLVWQQTITPILQLGHTFSIGHTDENTSPYQFTTDLILRDKNPLMQAGNRYVSKGQMTSQFGGEWKFSPIFGAIAMRFFLQNGRTAENKHEYQWVVEMDRRGMDSSFQFKAVKGGMFTISFLQSISKSIAVGIEQTFVHSQAVNMWSYGAMWQRRHNNSSFEAHVTPALSRYSFAYVQKPSDRLSLVTDLVISPNEKKQTVQTVASVGASFTFSQSQFKTSFNTNQQLTVLLLEDLAMTVPVVANFCFNVDLKKGTVKTGIGLNFHL